MDKSAPKSERGLSPGCRELVAWGTRFDTRRWWWAALLRVSVLVACAIALLGHDAWEGGLHPGLRFLRAIATIQLVGLTIAAATQFATALAPLQEPTFAPMCALTGLRPGEFLIALMAHRWWIGFSVWMLPLPLWGFAYTFGGVRL